MAGPCAAAVGGCGCAVGYASTEAVLSVLLAIDPGTKAGFALFRDRRVVWCRQVSTKGKGHADRFALFREALGEAEKEILREYPVIPRVVMEAPCYAANRRRAQGTEAALAERVGELRALVIGWRGVVPEDVPWHAWQAVAHAGMVLGSSEDRSLGYAQEVLGVPAEWLMGPQGGVLWDAATACALGGAVLGIRGRADLDGGV